MLGIRGCNMCISVPYFKSKYSYNFMTNSHSWKEYLWNDDEVVEEGDEKEIRWIWNTNCILK